MKVEWYCGVNKPPVIKPIVWDEKRKMFKTHSRHGGLLLYYSIASLTANIEMSHRGKVIED